jgi:hypothetical protein
MNTETPRVFRMTSEEYEVKTLDLRDFTLARFLKSKKVKTKFFETRTEFYPA